MMNNAISLEDMLAVDQIQSMTINLVSASITEMYPEAGDG